MLVKMRTGDYRQILSKFLIDKMQLKVHETQCVAHGGSIFLYVYIYIYTRIYVVLVEPPGGQTTCS